MDVKRHRPTEELDYITAFKDISHANGLGKRSHSYSHPASRAGERMGYDIIGQHVCLFVYLLCFL